MTTKVQRRKFKVVPTDPAWEAAKAARRSLGHAEAAAECAFLTEQYRRFRQPRAAGMVELTTVLQTLIAKKVSFVLTGAHGIAGWTGRPRSTHDVDILVKSGRNYARAVNALRTRFPELEVRNFADEAAFFLPGETLSLLDVTYPHRADLEETLATAIWVEDSGLRYRVPTLEAALSNKYGAMLTPNRDILKRGQDALDFATMVQHSTDAGRPPIDLERLRELGEKVWPGGGGAEILQLVEDVKAGKGVNLSSPGKPAE